MKTIIAGGRNITDLRLVNEAVRRSQFDITEVVSGKEPRGVDKLGEIWAERHGIPVKPFYANWTKYLKRAGPIRNTRMIMYADQLIALWDSQSRGTRDVIQQMSREGKPIFVQFVEWYNHRWHLVT